MTYWCDPNEVTTITITILLVEIQKPNVPLWKTITDIWKTWNRETIFLFQYVYISYGYKIKPLLTNPFLNKYTRKHINNTRKLNQIFDLTVNPRRGYHCLFTISHKGKLRRAFTWTCLEGVHTSDLIALFGAGPCNFDATTTLSNFWHYLNNERMLGVFELKTLALANLPWLHQKAIGELIAAIFRHTGVHFLALSWANLTTDITCSNIAVSFLSIETTRSAVILDKWV